jgi:hypothetical protein
MEYRGSLWLECGRRGEASVIRPAEDNRLEPAAMLGNPMLYANQTVCIRGTLRDIAIYESNNSAAGILDIARGRGIRIRERGPADLEIDLAGGGGGAQAPGGSLAHEHRRALGTREAGGPLHPDHEGAEQGRLKRVVVAHGDVVVGLEESQLPDLFAGNPAGRQVGNHAVLELDETASFLLLPASAAV